jgi:hypothetical protein
MRNCKLLTVLCSCIILFFHLTGLSYAAFPFPWPNICTDGIDNDMNGDFDCAEISCYADKACTPIELSSGTGLTGTLKKGHARHYMITASDTDAQLTVELTDLSADLGLFVRLGEKPNKADYDCVSWQYGTQPEACTLSNSGAATWYILVYANEAGSYTIKATLSSDPVSDALVVTEEGNVGIGINDPQDRLDVDGYVRSNGVRLTSDARWKENVEAIDDVLLKITQLRGVSFEWIEPSRGSGRQIGVIAQEVEEVFPEVVHTDSQGYKSVEYSKLVAPLIEAVKALQAEIEALRSENARLALDNNALRQVNQSIETRLDKLEQLLSDN